MKYSKVYSTIAALSLMAVLSAHSAIVSGAIYKLTPKAALTKRLHAPGTAEGTQLQIRGSTNGNAQLFQINLVTNGLYELESQLGSTNKVVTCNNGASTNGTPVVLKARNFNNAQKWSISQVDSNYYTLEPNCALGKAMHAKGATESSLVDIQTLDTGDNYQLWSLQQQ